MRNYWINKLKNFTCIILFGISMLESCEKDSVNSILTVDIKEFEFGEEGGTGKFNIYCNTKWSIDILGGDDSGVAVNLSNRINYNNCDWITVSPMSGDGDSEINFIVKADGTDDVAPRDLKLIVHTNDGRSTQNVIISQDGTWFDTKTNALEVFSIYDRYYDGEKGESVDSLGVLSNLSWIVNGPDWLEAAIGKGSWKPLSESGFDHIGSGFNWIQIRPISTNDDDEDRTGEIRITSEFTNQSYTIPVTQLGKFHVAAVETYTISNGVACTWKYGSKVDCFYLQLFNGKPSSSELSWSKISKWEKYEAKKDLLLAWDNLSEETYYQIIPFGVDNEGNHSKTLTGFGITTLSSKNQPVASISNISRNSEGWQWNVSLNNNGNCYYQWIYPGDDISGFPDSYVAWCIHHNINKAILKKNTNRFESWSLSGSGPIHIATLAGNYDEISRETTLSGVISRVSSNSYINFKWSTSSNNLKSPHIYSKRNSCIGKFVRLK